MKKISQEEAFALRKNGMNKFVYVVNRTHKSAQKNYFVVEDERPLKYLRELDGNRER